MTYTKYLMAVDLGASGGKCFIGTLTKQALKMEEIHRFDHEGVPYAIRDRAGTLTERIFWDDTLIYANILAGLQAARRICGPRIDSIGIDTWGADGQLISSEGDFIGKTYAYRDHRLDNMSDKVRVKISAERIYSITGIHFQPFNLSNQLLWLVENRQDLLAQASLFLPAPTLFYYLLGGVASIDTTWASVTQLMDSHNKNWSTEILSALNIPPTILPQIVEPGTRIGQLHSLLADKVNLDNRPNLIAVGGHDTASAFAAAPVENEKQALIISSGTWSLVGRLSPHPITTEKAMQAGVSNEGGIGNIRLLKNCMGGWLVQELRRIWRDQDGEEMSWQAIYESASAAPAFASFIDPDDLEFYNPENMEQALLGYCQRTNQQLPADRGGLLRAVYESLALKYRVIQETLAELCGSPATTVHIIGGGSRNTMLNQFTADSLNIKVEAGPVEATALGNLMLQAIGVGAGKPLAEIIPLTRGSFPVTTYRPNPETVPAWDKAYARFRKILEI